MLLGFVDHSARVMQVITWNRSFKGIPQPENVRNEMDDDEWETHATTLDKLLAWEKKLYHEVKVHGVSFLFTTSSKYKSLQPPTHLLVQSYRLLNSIALSYDNNFAI